MTGLRVPPAAAALLLAAILPAMAAPDTAPGAGLAYRTVTARDGIPLVMVTAGQPGGKGILFLHGFSMAADVFRPQLESGLAGKWYLVAFDLRGHGNSGKPWDPAAYADTARWADDVETVRRAAGLDRMVLVGWSFGGQVAMDYLRHHGEGRVAAVELVGSLARLLPPAEVNYDVRHMEAAAENAARALSLDPGDRLAAAGEFVDRLSAGAIPDAVRARLVVMPLQMPTYARQAMMGRSLDNSDLRSQIRVPLRFSHGAHDALVPPGALARLLRAIPTADAVNYPRAGHSPFMEEAEEFNRRLGAFARQYLGPAP